MTERAGPDPHVAGSSVRREYKLGPAAGCAALALLALAALTASGPRGPALRHEAQGHPTATLPVSLAAVVSVGMGASERGFWPARRGDALVTQGGKIQGSFTSAGARVRVAQGSVGLSLVAVQRAGNAEPVTAVAPTRATNRVTYRHGAINEFYRNGPYGLEQSFTLRHRPLAGIGSLVLALGVTGSLIPREVGSQVFFTTRAGARALQYGQLAAVDADGRRLPAVMRVRGGILQLRIDDNQARYPLRIDPFIQQGPKLIGSEEIESGKLGFSVALSADGNTALIGGYGDNNRAGAAWVFTRSGTTWTQQGGKLTGSGEAGAAEFGESVALSADGNTALIGGESDNGSQGAAWVFTRSGTTWTQQGGKLTAGGEVGAGSVGRSVALSADGNTALIGGFADNSGVGAAWVFTRSDATWTQQGGKLTGVGEAGAAEFGESVALSADGNTALIAGSGDGNRVGAVWAFTRSGTAWTQQGEKLTAVGEVGNAQFGEGVALSADGNTALIGCFGDNGGRGAAWVFTRSGTAWTQQGEKLTGAGESGAATFGVSTALSGDGNTALIGGSSDNGGVGAAWVFTRSGTTWTQQGEKLTGGGELGDGNFGLSVALSSDGNTALIGGFTDNNEVGAAWAFEFPHSPPTSETDSASTVTQTSATLNAIVNPNYGEVSDCHFEYGTSEAYGSTAPCTPSPGSGASPVAVSSPLGALTASTTYHFRIVATNASGTAVGADLMFTTRSQEAPAVVTEPASSITQTTAILNATVNPNGGNVSDCHFEYGTSAAYGSNIPCSTPPGSGSSAVAVSAGLEALSANTTYHFRIVATNASGTAVGADLMFTTRSQEAPAVVTEPASSITQTTAILNATVNPNGGNVSDCHFEYGTSAAYGSNIPCSTPPGSGSSAVAVSAGLEALSANTTYHFRISATNAGGTTMGSDATFKTLPNPATVVTEPASSITQTTAILNATVNPNGGNVSDCHFEYGTSEAYGSNIPCSTPPGSGSSAVAVSAALEALSANTTYHFRISATNAGGTTMGSDATFKTLPNPATVVTEPASSITQTTAILNATVNPNGGNVSDCHFEYGTSAAYGSNIPCSTPPGSGSSAVAVSAGLEALSANTTYHFRISATNAGGTTMGSDATFKTLPNPATVVTEPASSITQTTAILNATVNPNGGNVSDCHFEYGTSEAYGSNIPCSTPPGSGSSAVAVSAALEALSANTTYHFRIVATNSSGTAVGADLTFATSPLNPATVVTKPASSITQTSATLSATVNPNGGNVSDCHFEYGTSEAYGSNIPCSTPPGSGSSAVAVSVALEALSANTTYHFRISATNAGGTAMGSDATFKTLPNPATVVTEPASSITQTSATLSATVNPNGANVSDCHFEYGTSAAYGSNIPCSTPPGSGSSAVAVSAGLEALSANTTYHFRIVATNSGGTGVGGDRILTTPPPAETGGQVVAPGPVTLPIQTPTPSPQGSATHIPDAKLASTSLAVTPSGAVSVKVTCPVGESGCKGTVVLQTLNAVSASARGSQSTKRKAAVLTLASGSFTVSGGAVKAISLHLSAKARALVAATRALRVRATIVAHDAGGSTHKSQAIVTLRALQPTHAHGKG